jgi:hypothetical protein
MDNNQFQKNVYQVPSSPSGESLDVPMASLEMQPSQEEVDRRFSTIAREEVLQAFNQMTQDLEMSLSGYETRPVPEVELATPDPIAVELLQIAADLQERRARHLASLIQRVEEMGFIEKNKIRLTAKNPSAILNPTIEKIIDQESKLGIELFEHDPDVAEIKYFLHDSEWFHEQLSPVVTKKFTNKYEVTETSILKSSTFFNPYLGTEVTRTVYVNDEEARNLLIAAKKYYEKVTGSVYVKTPAPRFRFGSKNK